MTASATPDLPTDARDVSDVEESAWTHDDTPTRFHERIQANEPTRLRFEAALAEIHEHQATLSQVRKARSLTQTTLASLLEMDQSEVSRLERRTDMLLSTLRAFIQAAGGELELIATFPETDPIHLLIGPDHPLPKETTMSLNARKETTSKKAASAASKTLRSKTASKSAKSSAASALAQSGNKKVTGKKAATAASKTLRSKTATKSAKSAAASTLTQRSGKKKR